MERSPGGWTLRAPAGERRRAPHRCFTLLTLRCFLPAAAFPQVGVIGATSSRDKRRHSRVVMAGEDGYELYTMDHKCVRTQAPDTPTLTPTHTLPQTKFSSPESFLRCP